MSSRLAILLLVLLTLGVYFNSFDVPFYLDDPLYIQNNFVLSDVTNLKQIFLYNPPRFVGFLSFALDIAVHDLDVFGFHVVNTVIHLGCVFAVFFLVLLLGRRTNADDQRRITLAFFAAAVFAVHPLHTQAVVYIWQRVASMSAFFYVAALVTWLQDRRITALVLSLLAMFTKQSSGTLPAAMLLADFVVRLDVPLKDRLRKWAPQLIPPLILLVAILVGGNQEADHIAAIDKAKRLTSLQYFWSQSWVLPRYLSLYVWPQNLALEHLHEPTLTWRDANWLFLSLATVVCVLAWRLRRTNPLVCFGVIFYFLAHGVESSFIPLEDLMFEHRAYLPDVGLSCVLAGVAQIVWNSLRQKSHVNRATAMALILAAIGIVASLGLRAFERVQEWRTPFVFMENNVELYPTLFRPRHALGMRYVDHGDYERALKHLQINLKSHPGRWHVHVEYGNVLKHQKDIEGAKREFLEAIRLKGIAAAPEPFINLGIIYRYENPKLAREYFERALREVPGDGLATFHLAMMIATEEGVDAGIKYLTSYLEQHPFNPIVAEGLLNLKMERDKAPPDEAMVDKILRFAPKLAQTRRIKATLLAERKDWAQAQTIFEDLIETDGEDPQSWLDLAYFWLLRGDPQKSEHYYQEALRRFPESDLVMYTYARVKQSRGDLPAARQFAMKAVQACKDAPKYSCRDLKVYESYLRSIR